MSYDLAVYGQRPLSESALSDLLGQAGLVVDAASSGPDVLSVHRGVRRAYSFSLGLPVPVEPEDVPDEVTAAVLGASVLYEVGVEGSSRREVRHAIRFARRLALACDGAVVDQQKDEIWARGAGRAAPPVSRGLIDVVGVHWYVLPGGAGAAAATSWLELAPRLLPEALPRRFGSYEPLLHRFDRDNPTKFVDQVARESMLVFTKATHPCLEAALAGGASDHLVRCHRLTVHRDALDDARWSRALQRFFVEFAIATSAVFAAAEVERGLEWSGRGLAGGERVDRTVYLAGMGEWRGLPPYPTWWAWYGPDYAPLVKTSLGESGVTAFGDCLFHAAGEQPLDRDELQRRGLWLPPELKSSFATDDPRVQRPPIPASVVPERLRAGS